MITRSGAHGPPARPRYSRRYSRAPMFTVQPLFAIQPRRDPCSVLTAALAVASRVLFRKLKAKAKKTFVFISRSPVRLQNYSPQSSGVHTTASSRRRRPHKRQGAPALRSLASPASYLRYRTLASTCHGLAIGGGGEVGSFGGPNKCQSVGQVPSATHSRRSSLATR